MICILAPINPKRLEDLLYKSSYVSDINTSSSSICNLVRGLVNLRKHVLSITTDTTSFDNYYYKGEYLDIIVIGTKSKFRLFNYFPPLKKISHKIETEILPRLDDITIIHAHWCYEYAISAKRFQHKKHVFCTVRDIAPIIYDSINPFASCYSLIAKIYWLYKTKIFKSTISNKTIHFIANSYYTYNQILRYNSHLNPSIIPNSIEEVFILDEIPNLMHRKYIISIGMSLDDDRKNISTLLKAFSIHIVNYPNHKLLLIGNYHKNNGVHYLAEKLGIMDNVIFLGKLNRSDIIKYIDQSFLLIHPSKEETFGNIYIEAMARGVLCLGGEHSGATPFIFEKNKYGILCNILEYKELANNIKLIADNLSHYDNMRKEALNKVRNTYSNYSVAKSHLKVYDLLK